jgi:hypothetical protein
MTQKNVESVIGRLVTDEEFRGDFGRDPRAALAALLESGVELNRVEREALLGLDASLFATLSPALSLRLQRAALSRGRGDKERRSS